MGSDETAQAEVFLHQAEQAVGRSPRYADLCRRLAYDPAVAEILESPPRWDAPLRLLGGLHYLVLTGRASWDHVEHALSAHREFLRGFVAERRVQTNEVQRCWMLLPCFLEIAKRTRASVVDVIELGPSAGLNLIWDRYRYRYAAGAWGPKAAHLELSGEERRPVPGSLLEPSMSVRSRIGIDLEPVDVTRDDGALLLKSFVWPDQTWRLRLLDEAITTFSEAPPRIVRGDVADVLPKLLAERPSDALTLVWHTAVLGYLPEDRRQSVYDALAAGGENGELAFVETSKPEDGSDNYWGLFAQVWPGGERVQLAHADFHGAWLEWLA
ncbi:MAG: DUF2332 domain-containing protein [Actinomycetota bacterium]|nr:DUF2332 domain-containing protein [Actinomycetota bacterium]